MAKPVLAKTASMTVEALFSLSLSLSSPPLSSSVKMSNSSKSPW